MPSKIDLTGQIFGRLVVVGQDRFPKLPGVFWRCRCECGAETSVRSDALRQGRTTSCKCRSREVAGKQSRADITGHVFGRLTAIRPLERRIHRSVVWLCRCECGKDAETDVNSLRFGRTRSCGCLTVIHGQSRTRAYHNAQQKMRDQRCPPWADRAAIREVYARCPVDMVVDHVIPLRGYAASGLHIAENLQYLTWDENRQ